jgi:elongation factor Ts
MEQAFVKDANLTMKDIISSKIGELGENIVVRRFTRFAVGEGAETKTGESES